MAKKIFILGAGASHSAGPPLLRGFLDAARELLRAGEKRTTTAAFELVFDVLERQLPILHARSMVDLNDIEAVFNLIEMGRLVARLPGTAPDAIEGVAAAMRRMLGDIEGTSRARAGPGRRQIAVELPGAEEVVDQTATDTGLFGDGGLPRPWLRRWRSSTSVSQKCTSTSSAGVEVQRGDGQARRERRRTGSLPTAPPTGRSAQERRGPGGRRGRPLTRVCNSGRQFCAIWDRR